MIYLIKGLNYFIFINWCGNLIMNMNYVYINIKEV